MRGTVQAIPQFPWLAVGFMVVDVLMAVSAGLSGLLCGWFAYPAVNPSESGAPEEPTEVLGEPPPQPDDHAQRQEEQERLQQLADRLKALTEGVAADVDAHQTELRSISETARDQSALQQPEVLVATMNRLLDASEGLRNQLDQAQERLREQTVQLQTAEQRSLTDPLTQIANRRSLDLRLNDILTSSPPRDATLMLIDIDHFKSFNDNFGHRAGDEVLRQVGELLKTRCPEQGLAARYGGEEFSVVFDNATIDDCCLLAEGMRRAIGELSIVFEGKRLNVTASMGLAQWLPSEPVESWIERADRALYAAKDASRNCGFMMTGESTLSRIVQPETFTSALMVDRGPIITRPALSCPIADLCELDNLPACLAGLPTGNRILAEFGELAAHVNSIGVAFVTVVARLDRTDSGADDLRILARTVRSVVRSVDRIGLINERTVVIGMPQVDHESALHRSERIRTGIGYAFEAAGVAEPPTISISLSSNREHNGFEPMLRFALRNLANASEGGPNQLVCAWNNPPARRR